MPLPFALPVGFVLGLSLAWLARVELGRSDVPLVLSRPFVVACLFGLLVHAPVVGYFVALHGDWAYLYLVRWSRVPSAIDLALCVLAAAQLPLGFAVASSWAMAKRGSALLKLSAILVASIAIVALVFHRRLGVSASYAQYHSAFGVTPVGATPLGRGILLGWVALLAGWGWSAHVLRSPPEGR